MAPAARIVPAVAAGLIGLILTGCAADTQPDQRPGAAQPDLTLSTTSAAPATGTPTGLTGAATKPGNGPALPRAYRNELILGSTTADRPVGWTRTAVEAPSTASDHGNDRVDFRDPTGQLLLRIGFLSDKRGPDKALRDLVTRTSGSYPGYRLVSLDAEPDTNPQHVRVHSEWIFTFAKDGVTRKVVIRAIGTRFQAGPAYRPVTMDYLYYSAPIGSFEATRAVYDRAAETLTFDA
jgi:hypothetical protein